MIFQRFKLAVKGNSHSARRAVNDRLRHGAVGTMQAGKLFETGMEDLLSSAKESRRPWLS